MNLPTFSKTYLPVACCVLIFFCLSVDAFTQEDRTPWSGHFFFGQMIVEKDDPAVDGDDYEANILGMDAQKSLGHQGSFQYGVELGVLANWDSDTRTFSASSGSGGGSASVSMDINSYLVDCFFGGYIAVEPVNWLRLHAGAGPLVIWGKWETESNEPTPEPFTNESESKLGAGVYARVGLDIFFTDRVGMHAGARVNTTTLELEDSSGSVDIQGWQYYFGMAYHF